MADQLIMAIVAIVGALMSFGGMYYKGRKDKDNENQLEHKKEQLASRAKEATLNETITKNHEEIDSLDDDAVDDRLQQYYREDDEL